MVACLNQSHTICLSLKVNSPTSVTNSSQSGTKILRGVFVGSPGESILNLPKGSMHRMGLCLVVRQLIVFYDNLSILEIYGFYACFVLYLVNLTSKSKQCLKRTAWLMYQIYLRRTREWSINMFCRTVGLSSWHFEGTNMLKLTLFSFFAVLFLVTGAQIHISDKPLRVKAFGNLSPYTYDKSFEVLCAPCRRCNCACKLPPRERLVKFLS